MGLSLFNDSAQGAYFVVLIVLAPIAIMATLLRFVGTRRAKRKPGLEDWAAYAALITYIAYTIMCLYTLAGFNSRDALVLIVTEPEEYARLQKTTYAFLFLFPLEMFFAKLSVLALYHRVFGVNRAYTWWIYGLFVVHLIWAIVMISLQFAQCTPVYKFWYPFTPGTCMSETVAATAEEVVNSGIDFALVILAIFMLQSLHLPPKVKLKLYFLFGLGSIVGVIGFVKVGLQYNPNGIYVYTLLGLWATVQMACAIICCCAPLYGPVLPSEGFWSRITSRISISYYRSSRGSSARTEGSLGESSLIGSKPNHHEQGWVHLEENTMGLAWPETHQAEAHALREITPVLHTPQIVQLGDTIQVRRSVEVV